MKTVRLQQANHSLGYTVGYYFFCGAPFFPVNRRSFQPSAWWGESFIISPFQGVRRPFYLMSSAGVSRQQPNKMSRFSFHWQKVCFKTPCVKNWDWQIQAGLTNTCLKVSNVRKIFTNTFQQFINKKLDSQTPIWKL